MFVKALVLKLKSIVDADLNEDKELHQSGDYSIFRKITGQEEFGERLDDGIEILKELVVVV